MMLSLRKLSKQQALGWSTFTVAVDVESLKRVCGVAQVGGDTSSDSSPHHSIMEDDLST